MILEPSSRVSRWWFRYQPAGVQGGGGGRCQALDQTWVGRVQDSGGGGAPAVPSQILHPSSLSTQGSAVPPPPPQNLNIMTALLPLPPREPTARPSSSLSVSSSTRPREPRPLLPGTEPLAKASVNEMIFAPRRRTTVNLGQLEGGARGS